MKIKLKTRVAGPEYSGGPGDELDLPPRVASRLVSGGYAENIGNIPRTATAPPVSRKAVRPTAKQ